LSTAGRPPAASFPYPVRLMTRRCILVLLKAPRAGLVKTRLARDLGKDRAAAVYRAFLADQLAWVARFHGAAKRLHVTPAGAGPECLRLLPAGRRRRFRVAPQSRGDLGARMRSAFRLAFRDGCGAAVMVGTDAPLLGPAALRRAFAALESRDLVLGPTQDGGYYLVGLKRDAPALFRRMPWSTPEVLRETLARARAAGMSCRLLPRLRDVDTLADLRALRRQIERRVSSGKPFPRRTFAALRERG
jgi:uncharacterized protein